MCVSMCSWSCNHFLKRHHSDARDSTGDSDDESNEAEDSEKTNPNAGWADAMAKILGKKTSEDKPSILAKNKDLDKVKEKEKKERLERKKQVLSGKGSMEEGFYNMLQGIGRGHNRVCMNIFAAFICVPLQFSAG